MVEVFLEDFEKMEEKVLAEFIAENGHIFELKVAGDLKTILKMGNFRAIIYFSQGEILVEKNKLYIEIKGIKFSMMKDTQIKNKELFYPKMAFYVPGLGIFCWEHSVGFSLHYPCGRYKNVKIHKIVIY